MVVCLGLNSCDTSRATSQWSRCFSHIRISASRHDSRQEPYAMVPHVRTVRERRLISVSTAINLTPHLHRGPASRRNAMAIYQDVVWTGTASLGPTTR
jgi:hypothetical protein